MSSSLTTNMQKLRMETVNNSNVKVILAAIDKLSNKLESVVESVVSLEKYADATTIRAKFTGISKLADTKVYSKPVTIDGIEWRFNVSRYNNYLKLFFNGKDTSGSSFAACFELQLISQIDSSKVHLQGHLKMPELFTVQQISWGYDKFISFAVCLLISKINRCKAIISSLFEELYDEKMGFVQDDSILVAAVFKAFRSQ
ncbi:hypothetical protein PMAYCL1PPCAC_27031, partial [Pristionchus mayeri]